MKRNLLLGLTLVLAVGVVAAMAVLNGNHDGYTLLQSGNGGAIRAALRPS